MATASTSTSKPLRLLVVCPSWLGDVVMATPSLRLLRHCLKGTYIGVLVRPGMEDLLAGTDLFDEIHVDRASGMMGPKLVAARLRARRYDTALLLTNSFSTALMTRLAFIERRVGYDRDGRGLLLTDRLRAERRGSLLGLPLRWACVPALLYYMTAARHLTGHDAPILEPRYELGVTPEQQDAAAQVLASAGVDGTRAYAVLIPGGNNPAKRWPVDRFASVAATLIRDRGMRVLVSGSPSETDVVRGVIEAIDPSLRDGAVDVTAAGLTIGSLKGVIRGAKLVVTNDTGPRHIALAFDVPTVSLFGPTDPRWTSPPAVHATRERVLVADPTLTREQIADDFPDRCRIERIETASVLTSVSQLLDGV